MLSKLLRDKINKVIMALAITTVLVFGNLIAKANTYGIQPFNLSEKSVATTFSQSVSAKEINVKNSINQNMVQSNGKKILIYSTHTNEHNASLTVNQIAQDMVNKFKMKGYTVDFDSKSNFVGTNDYNNAYKNSREMLLSKGNSLKDYDLIIDLHVDSFSKPIETTINNLSVGKLMFPTVSENPNIKQQKEMIQAIRENLEVFSKDIVREETTHYRIGKNYYNSDLSNKFLFIENSSDKNDELSSRRANTYLVSAINTYLTNK